MAGLFGYARLWLWMMLVGVIAAPALGSGFDASFDAVKVYAGTWTVVSLHTMAGEGRPDTVVNQCSEGSAFYTCEQVVNGKSLALIVFTVAEGTGRFHSQPILPNGQAVGRGELTIAGDHWTFLGVGKGDDGKDIYYRTENYFTGRDKIHFEQFESSDNKTWVKKNSGDEVRVN